MKKILAVALVVLILGSITVFAMGFNPRGSGVEEGFRYGPGHMFNDEEFVGYGPGNMDNDGEFVGYGPGYMFNDEEFVGYGHGGYMYSEEFMEEFDIDEEEFYTYMEERHQERIEYFVEEGILTEEEGKEALENFGENYKTESGQFAPRGRGFGPGACFQSY